MGYIKNKGKMIDTNPIACITLNVNRINTGIKKQKLSDWVS